MRLPPTLAAIRLLDPAQADKRLALERPSNAQCSSRICVPLGSRLARTLAGRPRARLTRAA